AERVAAVVVECAERREDRNPGGAREMEWAHRERRRAAEERYGHVAPIAERAVTLERDRVAAPERRDQGERDGRMRARHEAQAAAVTAQPALEGASLFDGDHHVRGPRRMLG